MKKTINVMIKNERNALQKNLPVATSSEYLASIKEAREDYKAKRVKSHKEIFKHK